MVRVMYQNPDGVQGLGGSLSCWGTKWLAAGCSGMAFDLQLLARPSSAYSKQVVYNSIVALKGQNRELTVSHCTMGPNLRTATTVIENEGRKYNSRYNSRTITIM
ncbi:hypothetical protein Prudu_004340 [Prunus dulcis]|uniref:Uncharacterized protein n=1 Tax=Prunus dulcis TaxID=3755 RepID=A0A4Y1QV81_PRUDU|nr:hypothetical protein Prudu_004340 [Prunus dulcis]